MLSIGRPAAHRAGARPYHRTTASPNEIVKPAGLLRRNAVYDRAAAPIQDHHVQLTFIFDSSGRLTHRGRRHAKQTNDEQHAGSQNCLARNIPIKTRDELG